MIFYIIECGLKMVQIKLLSENAKVPIKNHTDDAGFDLYTPISFALEPGSHKLIKLDIAISDFPPNTYARVAPRSSLGVKGVILHAGVIDSNYQGNIGVILSLCNNSQPIQFNIGDRIAQLIFEKYDPNVEFKIVDDFLMVTERKESGFGSTGR